MNISLKNTRKQNTMPLCLWELERCRAAQGGPFLMLPLSQRHGWIPAPVRPSQSLGLSLAAEFSNRSLFETWRQLNRNVILPQNRLVEIDSSWPSEGLEMLGKELQKPASVPDVPEHHRLLLFGTGTEQEIMSTLSGNASSSKLG